MHGPSDECIVLIPRSPFLFLCISVIVGLAITVTEISTASTTIQNCCHVPLLYIYKIPANVSLLSFLGFLWYQPPCDS